MKRSMNDLIRSLALFVVFVLLVFPALKAQNSPFHDAPATADQMKNPYAGQPRATEIGGQLYAVNCASCHGPQGQGTGNIPALKNGVIQGTNEGELFWFITQGSANNGMPSWAFLSE
jgi:mono/diheme cytochrome c family protein